MFWPCVYVMDIIIIARRTGQKGKTKHPLDIKCRERKDFEIPVSIKLNPKIADQWRAAVYYAKQECALVS